MKQQLPAEDLAKTMAYNGVLYKKIKSIPKAEVNHQSSDAKSSSKNKPQHPREFVTNLDLKNSSTAHSIQKTLGNGVVQFHAKTQFRDPGILKHPGEEVPDPTSGINCLDLSFDFDQLQNSLTRSPVSSRICEIIYPEAEPFIVESPLEKFDRLVSKQFRALSMQKVEKMN